MYEQYHPIGVVGIHEAKSPLGDLGAYRKIISEFPAWLNSPKTGMKVKQK